jgi:putative nucleotidyltransferase with HDIG domain
MWWVRVGSSGKEAGMAVGAVGVADQLVRLPAQPFAATLVLRLVEDETASLADIARLVEMDPVLSARVIRLANTPHYGLRSGISSASSAVVLLGATAVRAVVAAAASCLLVEGVRLGPEDFWAHSVAVAAGSAVASRVLRVSENESFSAGLLHDIGSALLHRLEPSRYEQMLERCNEGGLLEAERAEYGATHCEVSAAALAEWHLPKSFVAGVEAHHGDITVVAPLAQALILCEMLAETLDPLRPSEVKPNLEGAFESLGFPSSIHVRFFNDTRAYIEEIQLFVVGDECGRSPRSVDPRLSASPTFVTLTRRVCCRASLKRSVSWTFPSCRA